VLIAVNKVDLVDQDTVAAFAADYRRVGYPVFPIVAKTGQGIDALLPHLRGKTTVLAGQSGVGKSRLMQTLVPGREFKVGDLTAKLRRGKHTTRHVELIRLPQGGLLADAPGFTYLTFEWMEPVKVQEQFPELREYGGQCRFDDCLHRKEPDCAVRAALAGGQITETRYQHYLQFLAEIENIKRW
jgi:ribosome biogenesis GTPase